MSDLPPTTTEDAPLANSTPSVPANSTPSKRPWSILGRLSKAIREQNWFAVALELVILILGVFIGLQVNNWNQDRIAQRAEADLLERLHLDVQSAQDRFASFAENRRERQAHLRALADVFFDSTTVRPLTAEECNALAFAYMLTFPPVDVPTLDEVTSGGQIRLVTSDSVRHAVLTLEQASRRARTVFDALNTGGFDLSRVHPELITMTLRRETYREGEGPYQTSASCAHREMSANAAFRNDLARSVSRNEGYVSIMIEPLAEALSALHTALDAELSIHHGKEIQP